MVLIVLTIAAALLAPAQVPAPSAVAAPAPAAAGGRGGSKSVRPPDSRQVRTSVNGLLGWRVGIASNVFHSLTFSESAAMADALGLSAIEGFSSQLVSPEIRKPLDAGLSPDEVSALKSRLSDLRLRMAAYHVESIPSDPAARRKLLS